LIALIGALALAGALFTADDSFQAIHDAAVNHGVSEAALLRVARCETHGTFDPYAVGDHGTSYGLFQLHRGGLLGLFYVAHSDPFDPYQAADFTAEVLAGEHDGVWMSAWSCW
jgi:hypothetical protein